MMSSSDPLRVRPLTHNQPLCVRKLLEEFAKVLIALLVCGTQHLQVGGWEGEWVSQSQRHTHTQAHTLSSCSSSQAASTVGGFD